MSPAALLGLLVFLGAATPADNPLFRPETPNRCSLCEGWNRPRAPVHVFGNVYWVGTEGLSVVALDTGAGLVLLDGGLAQSVPHVKQGLEAMGLRLSDVKLILNSHAHYDHAGGIAALQRESGATVKVSPPFAQVLRTGCPTADDPQVNFGCLENGLPRVRGPVQTLHDGEQVRLGNVTLTAHFTPGHTPGGTSWTWTSCEGKHCLRFAYADSLTPVAAEGHRFTPQARAFEASIDRIAALPCDVLLTPHPENSPALERVTRTPPRPAGAPGECAAYAAKARQALRQRLLEEQR